MTTRSSRVGTKRAVCDKAPKVPAYNAMPCGALPAVKLDLILVFRPEWRDSGSACLFFDKLSNILDRTCQYTDPSESSEHMSTHLFNGKLLHSLLCY